MQVTLQPIAEIYKQPDSPEGTGLYKVKVQLWPIDLYLSYKFLLFNAHTGQYALYPNSTFDKFKGSYVDNFEFSKRTEFYEELLEKIIDEVETKTGLIINRKNGDES